MYSPGSDKVREVRHDSPGQLYFRLGVVVGIVGLAELPKWKAEDELQFLAMDAALTLLQMNALPV